MTPAPFGRPLEAFCLVIALMLGAACRIEDHSPTGTRRDEAEIRTLLANYHRNLAARDWIKCREAFWKGATYATGDAEQGIQSFPIDSLFASLTRAGGKAGPEVFDVRVLRTEIRQQSDLAAAWVLVRWHTPDVSPTSGTDMVEHFVLRRLGAQWKVANLAIARSSQERS